jgi:Pvc16 N-terminal domain
MAAAARWTPLNHAPRPALRQWAGRPIFGRVSSSGLTVSTETLLSGGRLTNLLGISKTLREYLCSVIPDAAIEIGMLGAGLPPPPVLVFPYAVEEVHHSRTPPRSGKQLPPVLRLQYLVTSTSGSAAELQERLSRVLDAFDGHPVFRGQDLDGSISDGIEALLVQLRAPAASELQNIWTALGIGMRLSLYYEVTAEPLAA